MKLDNFKDSKIRIKFKDGTAYELEKNENIRFGQNTLIIEHISTHYRVVYPYINIVCVDYNNPRKIVK